MPVNGQDGSIPESSLIAQSACFFTFAAARPNIPAGTRLATIEYANSGWNYGVCFQAPGDPLWADDGIGTLESAEADADDLLAVTGGFAGMVPAGATVSLGELYKGNGAYVSPVDGNTYPGQEGLAKWTGEVLSGMTNLAVEQATQTAFGGAVSALEQAILNNVLSTVVVTPYVAPTGPTEVGEFPPAAKTIGSMMALLMAQNFQRTMVAGPDGMPVCGRSAAPTN